MHYQNLMVILEPLLKIKFMSDTIFLKTWYPVKVKKFYNPVTSLLLGQHSEWKGMRLTGQVRADENIATPLNVDSQYKKSKEWKEDLIH